MLAITDWSWTAGALLGIGAVFSGIASLIAALSALRKQKARSADDCDKRIKEIIDAFYRGMKVEPRDDEKWSHLP